jgi:membrane-bound lytic murein transglycosylase D
MLARHWWLLLCAAMTVGCESVRPTPAHPVAQPEPAAAVPVPIAVTEQRDAVPSDLWSVLRGGFELDHFTDRPSVAREIEAYQFADTLMPGFEDQARRYFAYVVDAVHQRQLPMELALLPIIESTLDPYAFSHRGASGLWQLIPTTAKQYGVTIDWWYDGRRDPIDSTSAALDYLTYLHDEFGDWLLAIAAYNGGEGRVRHALENARPGAGFFDLKLPRETQRYVPKVLALAQLIAEDDDGRLPQIDPAPPFYLMTIEEQIDIEKLANLGELPTDELFRLNAGLNRRATPPDGPYRLLVPSSYRDALEAALDQYPKDRVSWTRHIVKRGDTLVAIAKKYGTTVASIRATNALRAKSILHPNQSLLIGVAAVEPTTLPNNPMLPSLKRTYRLTYIVRRGDSLARIADRFNVSIAAIAEWNDVDPTDVLRPGRRLVLHLAANGNTG